MLSNGLSFTSTGVQHHVEVCTLVTVPSAQEVVPLQRAKGISRTTPRSKPKHRQLLCSAVTNHHALHQSCQLLCPAVTICHALEQTH